MSALIVSLIIFAVPAYHLPNLIRLPAINDITTDLFSPPQFRTIAALREPQANSLVYPGSSFIAAQASCLSRYQHIDAGALQSGFIRAHSWRHHEILDGKSSVNSNRIANIKPVISRPLINRNAAWLSRRHCGARCRGDANFTRIDMRSASRYGRHDLGANASRIRETFAIMKTRIARAEARRIDSLERRRIAKLTSIEKKKKARERLRRKKEQEASQGTFMLPKANFNQ